jgi:amino acid transporter
MIGMDSKTPSKIWYLLPFFLNAIGGIIAYFILKDKDRKFAEKMLKIGLVMVPVWLVIVLLLPYLVYNYLSGPSVSGTANLLSIDDFLCSNNTITAWVFNDGTQNTGPITVNINGSSCAIQDISPGVDKNCTIAETVLNGTYIIEANSTNSSASGLIACS